MAGIEIRDYEGDFEDVVELTRRVWVPEYGGATWVPIPDAAFLRWRVFEPMRRCGEQSLLIFCLGTFLALSGQVIVSHFEESLLSQVLVSVGGILIMCAAAYAAAWFKGGGPSGAGSSGSGRAAPAEAMT